MPEKYMNYYVELLSATVNDIVLRNISLQANAKISDDVIAEQQQHVQNAIEQQNTINDLNSQISTMQQSITAVEESKHQLAHIDTFRSELIKARKENDDLHDYYDRLVTELNSQITYLELTPAQRKKINKINTHELSPIVKDGGAF